MEYYNITALNNELTKLENTKNNIKNSLMNKGQNIADDRPFSNYVQNIDALGTVHQFNTKAEMDTTTNLPKGTLGIVYSDYKYSEVDTVFTDSIYLPKKLSYTYNEISNLGNNYILGELEVDENTLYARASVYDDGSETSITVSINGTMYNYVWENNVWTRLDADKGYIQISISNNLVYRTCTVYATQLFQLHDGFNLGGIYNYRNGWNAVNTQFTALAGDIWENTAYVNGGIVIGTLQVTENLTRENINKKLNVWNKFTNLSTISNDISFLFDNSTQRLLPHIVANNVINMAGIYNNCINLIDIDLSGINTINTVNMSNLFANCSNLNYLYLNDLYTNSVISMNNLFSNCTNLNAIYCSNWNTVNVKYTDNMFRNCENIYEIDLVNFVVTNLDHSANMFCNCTNLYDIKLTNWNLIQIRNIDNMFNNCNYLYNSCIYNIVNILPNAMQLENRDIVSVGIDVNRYNGEESLILINKSYVNVPSPYNLFYNIGYVDSTYTVQYTEVNKTANYDINGDILNNVLIDIAGLGYNNIMIDDNRNKCATLQNLPSGIFNKANFVEVNLSKLNLCKISNFYSIFGSAPNLAIVNFGNYNLYNVVNLCGAFRGCRNLTSIRPNLNWNTSNCVDMDLLFANCNKYQYFSSVSSWDVSNVKSMRTMFWNCSRSSSFGVGNWDVSNVTSMYGMFHNCNYVTSFSVSNWNTINVKDFSLMFSGCTRISQLNNIYNWDMSNAVNIDCMFAGCTGLVNLDLSNWNVCNVVTMSNLSASDNLYMLRGLFGNCYSLSNLRVDTWDTSNFSMIDGIFYNCTNLSNINIANWNTANVKTMRSTFYNCKKLETLDIANWDTSNVTNLGGIFQECSNLKSVDISNWNVAKVNYIGYMFSG